MNSLKTNTDSEQMSEGDNSPQVAYHIDQWERKIWIRNTRFYSAEVKQTLFGEWVLECCWGRQAFKGGQVKLHRFASHEEALSLLTQVETKRLKRGYTAYSLE